MSTEGRENSYAATIVETITQPLLLLDADLRVEVANPAFLQQFEVSEDQTVGRLVYDLGNGQWDIPVLRRLLEEVLEKDRKVKNFRVEHAFESIGDRIMLLAADCMRREGSPERILLAIADVTEREGLIFELEGQREFTDELIGSVRESLLILGWDLRVHSANQSFYHRFGVKPAETEGRLVYELGNGQWDIPLLRELLEEILPKANAFDDFEVEHDFETIGRRVMLLNGRRLHHLNLILLAIRDVTRQREQEARQQAFMGESQHRVKNILHSVGALAAQTRRGSSSLEEFFERFQARLGALARVQDLLAKSPSDPVALRRIVTIELDAVGAQEGRDFSAEGPTVDLPESCVQPVSLMIHELTTNAAKYGALKGDAGRIEIGWRMERRDDQRHLTIHWRERDVQIEDTSSAKGFGTQVIERSMPQMLGGTAELDITPEGAECRVEFPLPDL